MEDRECPSMVKQAFSDMQQMFGSESGREQLATDLQLCAPINSTSQQLRLIDLWIENAFASLGMENYPYSIGDLPAYPMREACSVMKSNVQATNNYVRSLSLYFHFILTFHVGL